MRIDFQSLKLFIAVCEHKSISRAAELENIAQSAASKRIALLEEALKVQLFARSNKGLELTPAAYSLLNHAKLVMRDVTHLQAEMADYSKGTRGQVRLHASVSPIVQYLPGDIRRFLALHPAIRIELEQGLSQEVVLAVVENAADIGIFGGVASTEGLRVLPYRTDRLVVIMPDDHPLAGEARVKFGTVAEFDLVGPEEGSYLNALVMRAAADLAKPLRFRIRVHGFEPACSMVEEKLGIALVPEHHARRFVATGSIVAVPLDEAWALRRWNIGVRQSEELSSPVELLVRHLSAPGE